MPTIERRLKKASKNKNKVSFLVYTPNSKFGPHIQSVIMKDFVIKKTLMDKRIIQGRDLAKELTKDIEIGRTIVPGAHRKKTETVIRSYRIDRIVKRSLILR